MRLFVVQFVVVVTFVPRVVFSGYADCDITALKRKPFGRFVPRIAPAPDDLGIAIVWQDSEAIHIQRFSHDCRAMTPPFEVNSTRDFWRDPKESGLSDAVGLGDGHSTIVAWTVDDDVWVRVFRFGGVASSSNAQLASASGRYRRADVRIAVDPSRRYFAVAWSAWQQDGDGWDVYVRTFNSYNAVPENQKEMRVNQETQHFQWRPQMVWCGGGIWISWINGTDGSCSEGRGDDCATGPFYRRIPHSADGLRSDAKDEKENKLNGDGPLAIAMTCCTRPDCTEDMASVFWLEARATKVQNATLPTQARSREANLEATLEVARRLNSTSRSHNSSSKRASFLATGQSLVKVHRTLSDNTRLASLLGATEQIDVGRFVMTAASGLLVLMMNDGRGTVYGQLLDFLRNPLFAYPRREIASGIQSPRAAWANVRGKRAIIFCSAQVGLNEDDSNFLCMRRQAEWLVQSGGLEFGSKLALVVVLSLIIVFCCVRHCTTIGRLRGRRRLIGDEGRRGRRLASQARIRELREQLAQIPVAMESIQDDAPARQPAQGSSCASTPSTASTTGEAMELETPVDANIVRWTSRAAGDVCSICQNEVAVWVALRPCGHTACRECVSRIVEMNQRCHLCRNPIEGVLPVYI